MASVGGRYGVPGWAVYKATKFAVVGLHDALRKELGGEGIRLSLIEPGAVCTNWGYNVPEEAMKESRDSVEGLRAEDIAKALVYSFAQPANVNLQEALIMPTKQIFPQAIEDRSSRGTGARLRKGRRRAPEAGDGLGCPSQR